MADRDDYLLLPIVGQAGVWVRLVNNNTTTAYVSTAASAVDGRYRMSNVPAGVYTVYTGPSSGGAWTATGDSNCFVPDQGVAPPTGVAATDTANINNALAALPVTGGVAQLQAGTYVVNATINLGNGTSSAYSTGNGAILRGVSPTAGLWNNFGAIGGTTIQWAGVQSATMVSVNGPIWGWGIQDLVLDGGAGIQVATGLAVKCAQEGDNRNLTLINCATSIDESSYVQWGSPSPNTMHNEWANITIEVPNRSGAIAVRADGNGVDGNTNTCYENFDGLSLMFATSTGNIQYGIILRTVDSMFFRRVHIAGSTSPTYVRALTFDYTGTRDDMPMGCRIDIVDFGGASVVIQNIGTPGVNKHANTVSNISYVNGRPADPVLDNLNWDGFSQPITMKGLLTVAGSQVFGSGSGIQDTVPIIGINSHVAFQEPTYTGGQIGIATAPSNFLSGSAAGDLNVVAPNGKRILFGPNGGSFVASIDSTGKGTFADIHVADTNPGLRLDQPTYPNGQIGVAGGAGAFFSDVAAGDMVVVAPNGKRILFGPNGGSSVASISSTGLGTFTGGLVLGDANITLATTTGTQIGTATAQKLALHGATPVIQRAGAAQVAAATTAATNTTPYGFTTAAQANAIVTLVNELRAAAVEKGLIKGAA